MNIGDRITISYKGQSQEMIVLSHEEKTINGYKYTIYNLNGEKDRKNEKNTIHKLYVREDASTSMQLDMEGHLVGSEEEIQGGDYYMIYDKTKTTSEDVNQNIIF